MRVFLFSNLRVIVSCLLLLLTGFIFIILPDSKVEAASSANITISATPGYLAMNLTNTTWTVNGLTGDSIMRASHTYLSNPLGDQGNPGVTVNDTSCRFTLGNPGNVNMSTTIIWSHFTGTGTPMLNSDNGVADANHFGGWSYWSGMTYAGKVIAKTSNSSTAYADLGPNFTEHFGFRIDVQTGSFSASSVLSSQVKVSVADTTP